jgi:anti-sigma factor RsiW
MKCRDVKSALTLYASGDLEFEEAARIHAHLGECLECTKALEREREMLGVLTQLGRDRKTPVKLMEEIKAGVMERLDREPERSLAVYKPPVSWDRAKTVLALAAAVLFAVLLVVVVLPKNRVGPVQTPGEGPPEITWVDSPDADNPGINDRAPERDLRWREPVEAPGEIRLIGGGGPF